MAELTLATVTDSNVSPNTSSAILFLSDVKHYRRREAVCGSALAENVNRTRPRYCGGVQIAQNE